MYGRGKSRTMTEPSFSSVLLDEIYRSIDEPAAAAAVENSKFYEQKLARMIKESEDVLRIEKWMEKGYDCKDKFVDSDNVSDLLFSSSSSSSSGSSSGGLSSTDNEYYFTGSMSTPAVSCFSRLKPIKTGGMIRNKQETANLDYDSARSKIVYNIKKAKQQPISPGGRLTSFINSIFSKSKNLQDRRTKKPSIPTKQRIDQQMNLIRDRNGKIYLDQKNPNHHHPAAEELVTGSSRRITDKYEEDDCFSDTSSDLFELDHLSFHGSKRFCEELPVYETTHLDSVLAFIQ